MFIHTVDSQITLKLLQTRHAEELFALTDANREMLREWLPWVDGTQSPLQSRSFIEMSLRQFADNQGLNCGIWVDGRLSGSIGFHTFDWANRKTSMGYWLGAHAQGQGVMSRACLALVRFAFEECGMNRIEIRAGTGNGKSRAVPERLGFKPEGLLRQAEWIRDHYIDHVVYSLLAEEWRQRPVSGS